MAGLLDFHADSPQGQAVLSLALGLLSAGGPQPRPVSFGQALGSAGMGAMQAYQGAQDRIQKGKFQQAQLDEMAQQARMREIQLKQLMDEQQRRAQFEQAISGAMQTPGQQAASLPGGPTVANAAQISQMPGGLNQEAALRALMAYDPKTGLQMMVKDEAPVVIGKGGMAVTRTGRMIASNPDTESKQTKLEQLIAARDKYPIDHPLRAIFDQAISKEATHTPPINVSYGAPVAGVDPLGNRVFFQPTKTGAAPAIVQGVTPPGPETKPMTDVQANANLYSSRMENADKIIRSLEGSYSRIALSGRQTLGEGMAGNAANALIGPNEQKVDQAQRDFVNAVLRRESGAVISPSEFANARIQYFPQPGDSAEVVKQKQANRRTAIEGIRAASGIAGEKYRAKAAPKIGDKRMTKDGREVTWDGTGWAY